MRVRRRRQEKDADKQRDDNRERGEDDHRMTIFVIVDLHHDKHDRQPERCRNQLLEREIVRVSESFFRNDGGGAEHHRDPESDENQRHQEEHPIGF